MRVMAPPQNDPLSGLPTGSRVVVRYRLTSPDAATGAHLSDVVGELLERSDTAVRVRTRSGVVTLDPRSVTAAKVLPPRASRRGAPHRALSVEDLERVMVDAWPATEVAELGGWRLRAAGGFTMRANSALVLGSPGMPDAAAVAAVGSWYAARGLPARLTVPGPAGADPLRDPVAAEVLSRGWSARVETLVMTASTAVAAGHLDPAARVEVSPTLSPQWFEAFTAYRRADPTYAAAVLTGSPAQAFATVRDEDDAVVAIGRLGVAHAWGGLGAMWVDPAHRRRGLATQLLATLAMVAGSAGARSLHLQVDADNAAARAAYARAGFEVHHGYVTYTGADLPAAEISA